MGGSLKLSPVILETRRTHYQSPALRNHRFVADGHSRIPCAKLENSERSEIEGRSRTSNRLTFGFLVGKEGNIG